MNIRNASHADKKAICALHVASINVLCHQQYHPDQLAAWTGVLEPSVYDHALENLIFRVAEDNRQRLIGFGMLHMQLAEINAVYVHPQATGMGVGTTLIRDLEDTARKHHLASLTVHATLNARGFYLTQGYVEQESTHHTLPNGAQLACLRMIKALDTAPESRR